MSKEKGHTSRLKRAPVTAREDYIKANEVRTALIEKAKKGRATYYSELMGRFHISRRWIGEILFRVADCCHSKKEPILTALVEYRRGGIGKGYFEVVKNNGADKDYRKEQEKCFNYWKNKQN
jgi:hypothetical protein